MALSDEDLAAISRLLDAKLAAVAVEDRRRRRFWIWFWVILTVVSALASAIAADRLIRRAQDELSQINLAFSETKLAYQRQLAQNQELRRQRAVAEKAVAYDSGKTQAEHEAGLVGSMLNLFSAKADFEKKYENADFADPKVLEAYSKELNRMVSEGLNPLAQVVLRNTDPAHNTADEKLRSDVAAPATTVGSPPSGTREPATAPTVAPNRP